MITLVQFRVVAARTRRLNSGVSRLHASVTVSCARATPSSSSHSEHAPAHRRPDHQSRISSPSSRRVCLKNNLCRVKVQARSNNRGVLIWDCDTPLLAHLTRPFLAYFLLLWRGNHVSPSRMATRTPQGAAPTINQRTSSQATSASSAAARQAEYDEELKPYVMAGELGKGSFATVYKGYHEVCLAMGCQEPLALTYGDTQQETHEQVAIKTVSRSSLTSKLFENLQSEIDILKSLSHRHITKLINIVVRTICIAQELIHIVS